MNEYIQYLKSLINYNNYLLFKKLFYLIILQSRFSKTDKFVQNLYEISKKVDDYHHS